MTRRKTVIFDCDGVLVDSEPLSLEAFHRALRDQGVDYPRDRITKFCGMTGEASMRIVIEETGASLDEERYLNAKVEHYKRLVEERGLRLFDGVPELLDSLGGNGVKLAIATSGPREKVQTSLRLVGLEDRFDAIVSGDDVPQGKPAPDAFLEAARRCGSDPAHCVGVEDTLIGLQAIRAAGMYVVAVAHTFPPQQILPLCDILFPRIAEIEAEDLME
ncbi:MAG TPA: HAD family phosphatase [bacterium]|nr:HAD family phosphatase [bacterium]HPO09852.1 HAD family phosphatase [bacterium]HQO33795.1 HAD family phosphatase [bacterium]HQP99108.1 HAD family phosphatase [bacterium]